MWQATKKVVAGIAEKTGKILDIVHISSTCPSCTKKQNERDDGKISSISYLEWFIKHEEHCLLNHVEKHTMYEKFCCHDALKALCQKKRTLLWPIYSAYWEISNANFYGLTKAIGKAEDPGNVKKRKGNRLHALV